MKRVAQIVLTTVLALTTCCFLSINTGSALAATACNPGPNFLLPGGSCTFTTTGMNTISVNATNTNPMNSMLLMFTTGTGSGSCNKNLTLDEQKPTDNFSCAPEQSPVTVLNTSPNTNATVTFNRATL